jgi:carbon-monoxide dehydrogenase small subunit
MTDPGPLIVNGTQFDADYDPGAPLVDVLRDDIGLKGTHVGCRNGDCGACTVLIDGAPYKSCIVPAGRVAGQRIETLDGLADGDDLHPVQQHFWTANAFQCGFCLAGQVLCTVAALRDNPAADPAERSSALAGNLCRCTGYQQIIVAASSARETSLSANASASG